MVTRRAFLATGASGLLIAAAPAIARSRPPVETTDYLCWSARHKYQPGTAVLYWYNTEEPSGIEHVYLDALTTTASRFDALKKPKGRASRRPALPRSRHARRQW